MVFFPPMWHIEEEDATRTRSIVLKKDSFILGWQVSYFGLLIQASSSRTSLLYPPPSNPTCTLPQWKQLLQLASQAQESSFQGQLQLLPKILSAILRGGLMRLSMMNTDCELAFFSKYRALINVVNNQRKQGSGTWEDWFWHVIIQPYKAQNQWMIL